MKKCFYTASIVLFFSLLTIPSVLAKPKVDRGNPNVSVGNTNFNLPRDNHRSNAGGRLRGQERAAYVRCLNAVKKNREFTGINNCSQNQLYREGRSTIQESIENNLPVIVTPTPQVEHE